VNDRAVRVVGAQNVDRLANQLLAHLPQAEWNVLEPDAEIVALKHAQLIFQDSNSDDATYFPLTCIISMIAEMRNGEECEYGCIGREGMLGLQIALGAQPLRGRGLCQLQGKAIRFRGELLRRVTLFGTAPHLHRLLLRYAQTSINVLAQAAACNALHSVDQRAARWLLQSEDSAGSDSFSLTQEFLARMLGVRRASVTEAALKLNDAKVIEYHRGNVRVLDHDALAARSCECYQIMRSEYEQVFK
jgi:CRP-like cAMP-binding protein